MSNDDTLAAIRRFLTRQHVVTLAVGQGEALWCADCFYALDAPTMTLYLLTSPTSHHGQLMSVNPRVAGTVAYQTRSVAKIQGIQFHGRIACLDGEAATAAYATYYRRFPLARARPSPVWGLCLMRVKMIDNTCGFGHKRHWAREGEPVGVY